MKLTVEYEFTPKQSTCNTSYVQSAFGIGFEVGRNVIARDVELDYPVRPEPGQPGKIVLFVGPSGSGKSSLLRAAAGQVESVRWLDESAPDGAALIDTLGPDVRESAHLLSLCGLAEAFLMLRSPAELSDGQRYRYAIARCLAGVNVEAAPSPLSANAGGTAAPFAAVAGNAGIPARGSSRGHGRGKDSATVPPTIVADEWCAKLDRTTAQVISRNARKIADRRGVGFLLATTHEDLLDDLQSDLVVSCRGGGMVEVERRRPFAGRSVFGPGSKSPAAPSRTGRTSLGGITAGTASARCGG